MKTATDADRAQLRRLINGYQVTQALHVVAVLAIPDHLAASPRSATELAREVGADEVALYRVLSGGDAYVVKAVLHNWRDQDAKLILASCRKAMGGSPADLLVIERLVPGPNEGADVKFMDLNMFVGPSAYERSREEWQALLEAGGFKLRRIVPTDALAIIEAAPV